MDTPLDYPKISGPSGKDRIIFPLDVSSLTEAERFVRLLKDHVGLFKVGLTLFVTEGLRVVEMIEDIAGPKVFLDLKFYDIPETVGSATSVIMSRSEGIRFITVHTSGGERIVRAVVEKIRGGTGVLGVTVLTSMDEKESEELGYTRSIKERVMALAGIARRGGCVGVVCSGSEARAVREGHGEDFVIVTPGIRPAWSNIPKDDQRRIMTPEEAIRNGADYIVVGRPIYTARDPIEVADRIAHDIEEGLRGRTSLDR